MSERLSLDDMNARLAPAPVSTVAPTMRLSLDAMQARLAGDAPRRLSLDEMQDRLGGVVTPEKEILSGPVQASPNPYEFPGENLMALPEPGQPSFTDVTRQGHRYDPNARPLFDPAHDTIRSFLESFESLKRHAGEAFPPPPEPTGEGIVGVVKRLPGELAQVPGRFVSAAAMPLDVLGMAMAPITGAARATIGSAFSYVPTGVKRDAAGDLDLKIVGKEKADQATDMAMMALGPAKGNLPRMAPADLEALRNIPRGVRLSLSEFQDRLRAGREAGPPERVEPVVDLPGLRPVGAAAPARPPDAPVAPEMAPNRPDLPAPDSPVSPEPRPEPKQPPEPAPATSQISRFFGEPETVVTPRGRRVEVRPELVEASDLVTSHGPEGNPTPGYPEALQPRDRSRAASRAQVQDIAANLQPELLGRSASAGSGAPIVGRTDNYVESGNGRVMGIRRAYAEGLPAAQRYRDWLADQGLDVSGFKEPILVRRRATAMDETNRAAFAAESNERPTLAMSASEQALSDARNINADMLATYQGGDLLAAGNRKFIRAFVDKVIPASERGGVMTADGQLSQAGHQRIQNALFARAFDDGGLLATLREAPDTSIRGIGEAMADAAPTWARMRGEIEAGRVPAEVDPTRAVLDAARIVQRARETGVPVSNALRQGDIFAGGVKPETAEALRLFFRDERLTQPRARPRIAEALRAVADQAARNEAGPGLFPGAAKITAADILKMARERLDGGLLPDVADSRAPGPRAPAEPGKGRARLEEAPAQPPLTPAVRARLSRLGWSPEDIAGMPEARAIDVARRAERKSAAPASEATEPARPAAQDQAGDTLPDTAEMTPGANYVGPRRQVYDPAVEPAAKPVRREDVLAPLFKAFGVPLYEGRIKSDRTLGFFRKPIEEVRVKRPGDIETAAHEIAHLLDSRVPEIRAQWTPASKANAAVRAELAGVSYDKSKLYEGFAEYTRHWLTNPAEAQKRAPQFHQWFEDFTLRDPHGPALRQAQTGMTKWFEQAALDRARSKIGVPTEVNAFLDAPLDKFRASVFDDLHGILRAERDLTGKVSPVGAYETARLTRAKASIADGAVRLGAPRVNPDGSHSFVGKGLEQILKPIARDLDDALMYFVGRSARELAGQGREHLFSPAEINAMVALERPAFRTAFDEYQLWNQAILDFAEAKGVINPAFRATWRRADYMPFHRVGQPGGGGTGPVPGDWQGIKALTGGSENLRDVLGNMVGNARMLIDAALTNEARLKVAELAKRPGGARLMAKIPAEEATVKVHPGEVRRAILEALGVKRFSDLPVESQKVVSDIVENMRPMAEFMLHDRAPRGPDIVAVLRGGKPEYYQVPDPILYRALQALNRPAAGWLTRLLAVPKRIGQASVTLTFDFMAANLARDAAMGAVMSKHGFLPFVDSARGMKSRLTKDQTYREFLANGGGMSSQFLEEGAFRTHLGRFYGRKGIDYRHVLDAPGKLLFGLERIAEAFEMATRLGEYRKAIRRGEHPRHAAYSAREVSTDFAMRGDSAALGFLYDTVLFLKAGMNGMDRLYRGVVHDPNRGAIAAKAGVIAGVSGALYALLNRGNPLYDQLEDWDRDTHWHLFVPKPETLEAWNEGRDLPALKDRYLHLRYPKIWEIGALASLAERSIAGILDGLKPKDALAMLKTIGRTFNLDYLPAAVAPLAELGMNRDRFTDRPIENQAVAELQPWSRATPGTPIVLRRAGEATRDLPEALQVNPIRTEHLLRGYLNTWAMYGLSLADTALYDQTPELRTDDYPVLRRFYREEPVRHTRYETELFEAIREATEARRTMKFMDRRWRPDLADELENRDANVIYGQTSRIAERFQVFRREAEQVLSATQLDQVRKLMIDRARQAKNPALVDQAMASGDWHRIGAIKRALLDDLTAERNAYAERAWRDLQARRGEMKLRTAGR